MPDKYNLDVLRERVRGYMSEKRYVHTLGVEEEAGYLARIYMPERESELRAAALLHDIAKELSSEKQLNYIRQFDIIDVNADELTDSVLHGWAAGYVIKRDFPEYMTQDIVSAVAYHSTGHENMTVFEAIVFLSDYIECGRKHERCRECRRIIHEGYHDGMTLPEAEGLLYSAVVKTLKSTIEYVNSSGKELCPVTVRALECLEDKGTI